MYFSKNNTQNEKKCGNKKVTFLSFFRAARQKKAASLLLEANVKGKKQQLLTNEGHRARNVARHASPRTSQTTLTQKCEQARNLFVFYAVWSTDVLAQSREANINT